MEASHWGYLDGRLVAVDYSAPALRAFIGTFGEVVAALKAAADLAKIEKLF